MLQILGAGAAYPASRITTQLLREINPDLSARDLSIEIGLSERRSILAEDFVRNHDTSDPWISRTAVTTLPTDLSYEAAQLALERAGVRAEQIGLIIGETATPFETTPTEAQRVGKRLGLKVPAYDVACAGSALLLHLHVLSQWEESAVPDYVLCVSANSPTQRINYRKGSAGAFLGDCGAAMVVSASKRGRLSMRNCKRWSMPAEQSALNMGLYGCIELDETRARNFFVKRSEEILRDLVPQLSSSAWGLLGTPFSPADLEAVCRDFNIPAQRQLLNSQSVGYSLGSAELSVLADRWDGLQGLGEIVVVDAAPTGESGYIILECAE